MGVTTPKEYTPAMQLYKEKNELLSERFEEVSAYEFYRDIFPEGSFEVKGKLLTYLKGAGKLSVGL